ncbi:MAG TPA: MarR family transcriptional regulator [Gemmatimonadaceae bacterium]|nr:MarR family transcriptional regulator [Gemmatimonadaceae bacterium]
MKEIERRDPIFFMLLDAGRAQFARLEEALKSVGLSAAKYKVLSQIAKSKEPVPLRLLAEEQQCVASNVTTLVDRLEADGLVRRVDDPADRRSRRAELTELGKEKAEAGARVVADVEAAFAESLGPTERLALAKVLGSLR